MHISRWIIQAEKSLSLAYKQKTLTILIIIIICLGLAVRLAYISVLPPHRLAPDERDYIEAAEDLVANSSFSKAIHHHVPPVVPIVYASVFCVSGTSLIAIRWFQAFLFAIAGILFFFMGKEVCGKLGGILALFFCAVYPYFIYNSAMALTEDIATYVITGCLLAAVVSVHTHSWKQQALFGILLAIATLTRASPMYFLLAVPFVYIIGWGVKNTRWIKASSIVAIAFFCVYAPWVGVNYRYYGKIMAAPTIGAGVLLYQTALRLTMPDEKQRSEHLRKNIFPKYYYAKGATYRELYNGNSYLEKEGKKIIFHNLDKYPEIIWFNFKRFWQFYSHSGDGPNSRQGRFYLFAGLFSYGILFPFFLAGLLYGLSRFKNLSALYGFMAYFTLLHALLYGKLRYRIPMDPIILSFAALGLLNILKQIRPRWISIIERKLIENNGINQE